MENIKKNEELEQVEPIVPEEEGSSFDLMTIYTLLILNWQWFLVSMFIFVCGALLYLRYADPVYSVSAKVLVKEEENSNSTRNSIRYIQDLGTLSASTGIDNEVVILQSQSLSYAAVKNLKLYRLPKVGERLTTEVHILAVIMDMTLASVMTKVNGEVIAETRMKLAMTHIEAADAKPINN
jgi:uncharacterized protein involved in exopolysaccharide biosynthesis